MKTNRTILMSILICASFMANAQWAAKAPFGGAGRTGAVGFSIGTKGYIGTGYTTAYSNDFWEWNQGTNTWVQKTDFPGGARSGAVGFSIGTKGYIGTGYGSTGSLSDFWEWDQASNTWTQKTDYPGGAMSDGVGFSIGTKGYILNTYNDSLWEWDPASSTWTRKASFPGTPRGQAIGFSIGTKGYFGIGYSSGFHSMDDFWEWDQATDTWTQKASYPVERDDATAFSIGTTGYICTGHDNYTGYSSGTSYKWDQATNTWSAVSMSGFGVQEGMCVGFSIGTKGYVGTGYDDPGNQLKLFYELSGPAGVDNITLGKDFSVFPNPFTTSTTLRVTKSLQNATLVIYDFLGKEIKQMENLSGNEIIIQRDRMKSGMYFYSLFDKTGIISKGKMIVE